jgi:hypothetical protein
VSSPVPTLPAKTRSSPGIPITPARYLRFLTEASLPGPGGVGDHGGSCCRSV